MIEVSVNRAPAPVESVTITVDERTARALHALSGLGTAYISHAASPIFRDAGFSGVDEVVAAVQKDDVWHALGTALGAAR